MEKDVRRIYSGSFAVELGHMLLYEPKMSLLSWGDEGEKKIGADC